jgi:hypothetical protein
MGQHHFPNYRIRQGTAGIHNDDVARFGDVDSLVAPSSCRLASFSP